jgi:hypothetical protein
VNPCYPGTANRFSGFWKIANSVKGNREASEKECGTKSWKTLLFTQFTKTELESKQ